jgi:hypothetical protein
MVKSLRGPRPRHKTRKPYPALLFFLDIAAVASSFLTTSETSLTRKQSLAEKGA